jgi:hypothetical protein
MIWRTASTGEFRTPQEEALQGREDPVLGADELESQSH